MIKAEIAEIKQDPRDRSERFGVFAKKIGLFIMGKAGQFANRDAWLPTLSIV